MTSTPKLTPTEAAAVLAYRANVSIADIVKATEMRREYVEAVLMNHPHYRTDTAALLATAVGR
jgi:hypothetical protein